MLRGGTDIPALKVGTSARVLSQGSPSAAVAGPDARGYRRGLGRPLGTGRRAVTSLTTDVVRRLARKVMGRRPAAGEGDRRRRAERRAALGVAACAAYLVIMFFTVDVCDDQLAVNGTVHRVCRHPQLTDAFMAPVAALTVVALSTYFAEISGFGITLKRRLDRVEDVAADARNEARDALLAARYNAVRAEHKAGADRDAAMHQVWSDLVRSLRDERSFDLSAHLGDRDDPGRRLAGYAYLAGNPDGRSIDTLVDAIRADDKPFNQEKGLEALRKVVERDCSLLTPARRAALESLRTAVLTSRRPGKPPSKRVAEIDRILEACPG